MASSTSFPVKANVVIGHLQGDSMTQIAKDLGITRQTVSKIIEESEVNDLFAEGKSILLRAIPDSARTVAEAVKKDANHAFELLDRSGAFPKNRESTNVNIAMEMDLGAISNPFQGKPIEI
jgi:predicted transcriptional regulator